MASSLQINSWVRMKREKETDKRNDVSNRSIVGSNETREGDRQEK